MDVLDDEVRLVSFEIWLLLFFSLFNPLQSFSIPLKIVSWANYCYHDEKQSEIQYNTILHSIVGYSSHRLLILN